MLANELGVYSVDPGEAFEALKLSNNRLVDVRTDAEWSFVGIPDLKGLPNELICEQWSKYPLMNLNESFVVNIIKKLDLNATEGIYFICRSGARSMHAAAAIKESLKNLDSKIKCFNVNDGFEGDKSEEGQRGQINGWKLIGLPWVQS